VLLGYLRKIERVHGDRHPELREVRAEFEEAMHQLSAHMEKEETIVFPFIERIEKAKEGESDLQGAMESMNIEDPIRMMEHEHEVEGERFRKISQLTKGYTPPRDACQTYRVSFQLLEEFEKDLHRHIHLENNILFIKAKEMYKRMTASMH
jgi:regulator of cell morphogenesis and NO signaling